jgi:hypothetical protein
MVGNGKDMALIVLGIVLVAAGLGTAPLKVAPAFVDPQRSGRILVYCGFALAFMGVLQELMTPG